MKPQCLRNGMKIKAKWSVYSEVCGICIAQAGEVFECFYDNVRRVWTLGNFGHMLYGVHGGINFDRVQHFEPCTKAEQTEEYRRFLSEARTALDKLETVLGKDFS